MRIKTKFVAVNVLVVAVTLLAKAVAKAEEELGSVSGIINFNCILRTLELNNRKLTEEHAKIFAKLPTIGFSPYGEQYIGHINQTATMLVFG